MSIYYCHDCSVSLGLTVPQIPTSLTGTNYQLERYIKHTAPTGTYFVNSIFDDPTYPTYNNYIVTGTISGLLEVDNRNRNNLIWYAGERTGVEYRNGVFFAPANGIKIVLSHNSAKIHAFPITDMPGTVNYCANCGKSLPMWHL